MAQVTDRTVDANPTGFDMRTELNNIIGALETDNSGASAPLNTVAYMKWLDTSNATYYYYKERNHDNSAWVTLFRYTVATKIMEAVSNGVVLSQTNIASEIHASSSKTTPVNDDEIGLIDSASTFTLKKLTWANLKATLKTYFDTLYVALSGNQTIADIKTFTSSPIVPTPTTDYQCATKEYVDNNSSSQAVLQTAYAELTTSGTGTGRIPADATIPQQTEGNEILTLSIKPTRADSYLLIQVNVFAAETANAGDYVQSALFRDNADNAIASKLNNSSVNNTNFNGGALNIQVRVPSISTATTTFKLRVGVDVGTVRWNGTGATQYGGASALSSISIMEVL